MQAVIKSGGKQYLVSADQTLEIDLVSSDKKQIEFEPLMVIDGDKISVGTPVVSGVKVVADVVTETKGDKIKVLKFKPKKRIKKLTGHRQHYTQIKIASIGGVKAASKTAAAKKPAATKPAAK